MDVNVTGIGFALVVAVLMHSCVTEDVTRISDTTYRVRPPMWDSNRICTVTGEAVKCVKITETK